MPLINYQLELDPGWVYCYSLLWHTPIRAVWSDEVNTSFPQINTWNEVSSCFLFHSFNWHSFNDEWKFKHPHNSSEWIHALISIFFYSFSENVSLDFHYIWMETWQQPVLPLTARLPLCVSVYFHIRPSFILSLCRSVSASWPRILDLLFQ